MKTTTSDLLKRLYDIAVTNDPKQTCLITIHRHLHELGYQNLEAPDQAPGDLRFAHPDASVGHSELQLDPSAVQAKANPAPRVNLTGILDGGSPPRQCIVLREPATDVYMAQLDILSLTERLGRCKGNEDGSEFIVGNRELTDAISYLEQIVPFVSHERPIPQGWVPCSPSWLKAGGDCATAPRVYSKEQLNHYHPPVVTSSSGE